MGLRYPDPAPASESGALRPDELFVVKIQAPLDDSSDAAAGIGRMVPTTLLPKDRHGALVRRVEEEERGHNALLSAALRRREQSVHVYAELRAPFLSRAELRVYPEPSPRWTRRTGSVYVAEAAVPVERNEKPISRAIRGRVVLGRCVPPTDSAPSAGPSAPQASHLAATGTVVPGRCAPATDSGKWKYSSVVSARRNGGRSRVTN